MVFCRIRRYLNIIRFIKKKNEFCEDIFEAKAIINNKEKRKMKKNEKIPNNLRKPHEFKVGERVLIKYKDNHYVIPGKNVSMQGGYSQNRSPYVQKDSGIILLRNCLFKSLDTSQPQPTEMVIEVVGAKKITRNRRKVITDDNDYEGKNQDDNDDEDYDSTTDAMEGEKKMTKMSWNQSTYINPCTGMRKSEKGRTTCKEESILQDSGAE
jgi:hypothetical protein